MFHHQKKIKPKPGFGHFLRSLNKRTRVNNAPRECVRPNPGVFSVAVGITVVMVALTVGGTVGVPVTSGSTRISIVCSE